jgi:small subunit ribosomal protein S13
LNIFMPRLVGIDIPNDKKIEYSLTYIHGIGLTTARVILKSAHVAPAKKASELTAEEVSKIASVIDKNYKVEGDLRREVGDNIKRLKEIGTWRGVRHARRLPIHGRTKVNSRTVRGNLRKTMGSGKKTPAQKT